jgi:5-methylcytosine-specific restriction endonuclease McrA
MHPFRQDTPKHTANRRVCKHYKSYKITLRADFNKRCGYCNDYYHDHKKYFVIDHFVPQNPDGWTHTIRPNKYNNLIYACSYCNGAKSNKWPTMNPKKSNDGVRGFIKPTKKLYSKLFRRNTAGSIVVHNNHLIGKYLYNELKFDLEIHALNWKFEILFRQEQQVQEILKKTKDAAVRQEIEQIRNLRLGVMDSRNIFFNA